VYAPSLKGDNPLKRMGSKGSTVTPEACWRMTAGLGRAQRFLP